MPDESAGSRCDGKEAEFEGDDVYKRVRGKWRDGILETTESRTVWEITVGSHSLGDQLHF